MNRKAFEQEILRYLKADQRRHPAMEQQDAVKFVFQAMLGSGHLLPSRTAAEEYITQETEQLSAGVGEPLCEPLSPSWCRLSLRGAKERNITPPVITGLMLTSDSGPQFTRQDVFSFCKRLAVSEEKLITDQNALVRITDETWLPSHSPAYRNKYHPAYRVISTGWISCMEAIGKITDQQGERILVTIDGPCASGKTTLSGKLAEVFGAAVVHTDDYVIPHAQKTAERLAVPGGNCDADRLASEVVAPWKRGDPVIYRRYDCKNDTLLPEERLPDCRVLILEGSYCGLPAIRKHADVRIFVCASMETRERRLRQRESAQSIQMFYDRWIPLEDAYFAEYQLPDDSCIVINEQE